ncbi:class I SAM-dependent methyltransferase [Psychromarinibacter sp. C21-152]|uniref:Class I SAM-dependent methyltransferase n=1 Tax=Psychromarinibacter sediminicola TaxID=3033385 RepID=A0AAE3NNI6_9RHOB|nr:class I SAM-dependent methyltransferase [Psychromarinibacter sediminicola]MDF0600583.1 class I SAM-dependent methyltransferase [Psychromarinibacter sediminicola]
MGTDADRMIEELDLSMFGRQDFVNIVLQRSDVLGYTREANRLVRSWEAGDAAPLEAAVDADGDRYAREAARLIRDEFVALRGLMQRLAPARIADIGCGYAIFDLFAYRALDCDLLLIDIEETESRHFGFANEGAGYSSLARATEFLVANGVPEARIRTWNPNREEAPGGPPIDIAVSFLSCGFHYPVDMYLPFFRYAVAPRGAVILDLRGSRADRIIATLETLGKVRVLRRGGGVRRVLLKKRDAE